MTEAGCELCPENTFSEDGADECTSCPGKKVAPPGSTSSDDCVFVRQDGQFLMIIVILDAK